jgi:hypothetical protein
MDDEGISERAGKSRKESRNEEKSQEMIKETLY